MPRYSKRVLEALAKIEESNKPKRVKAPRKQWYVLLVKPGTQDEVKRQITRRVRIEGLQKHTGPILVPKHKEMRLIKGRRETQVRRDFRGYLLCYLSPLGAVMKIYNTVPGSFGFRPNRSNPVPLSWQEMKLIQERQKNNRRRDEVKVVTNLRPGDTIRMIAGMFEGSIATVESVVGEGTKDPVVNIRVKVLGQSAIVPVKHYMIKPEPQGD